MLAALSTTSRSAALALVLSAAGGSCDPSSPAEATHEPLGSPAALSLEAPVGVLGDEPPGEPFREPFREPVAAGPQLVVRELETPAGGSTALGNLALGADGQTYLTWVESTPSRTTLHIASASSGVSSSDPSSNPWSEPRVVASGENWFRNWADFPGAAALVDGTLLAYWFERFPNPEYPTGYYAWWSLSSDGGATWSKPERLHDDRSPVEHGFVSAIAVDRSRFGLAWLDGRAGREAALSGHGGHGHGAGAGAPTQLRFRTLDRSGRLGDEVLLDDRVCDCCQTDAVTLESVGPYFVYRDRDAGEGRDISSLRRAGSRWAEPEPFERDGWKVAGCPVNGPSVAALGRRVGIVRYTEGADTLRPNKPLVLASLSRSAGQTFEPLGVVDDGEPAGRVGSAMLADGTFLVSWLERVGRGAEWRVRAYSPAGVAGPSVTVAETTPMRAAGFARLAAHGDGARIVWTDVEADRIRTAEITLR